MNLIELGVEGAVFLTDTVGQNLFSYHFQFLRPLRLMALHPIDCPLSVLIVTLCYTTLIYCLPLLRFLVITLCLCG